jgi:hypothetical protein
VAPAAGVHPDAAIADPVTELPDAVTATHATACSAPGGSILLRPVRRTAGKEAPHYA